jgi:probable F420-dependent oxidoreductase
MPVTPRIAVTLPPASPRLSDTVERLKWAQANGISEGWFRDGAAPDPITAAAAVAHEAGDMRIGIAVTPVYTRTPAVLAASLDVLSQVLPGRFVLGLGSSSQAIIEGWHGIRFEKPLTRVRETTLLLRSMLNGEKSDFDGETLRSHGYRQFPLQSPVPIYLAALRPKMIETAAELGDGVIFNLWPRRALPKMMEHVRIGAERAGKNWRDVEVVNRFMIAVTDDKAAAREVFRAQFTSYYATPVYNKFLAWAGYEDAAAAIREGWAARDRAKTSGALSDDLIDEIAIIGSAEECHARMREAVDQGVHTCVLAPLGRRDQDTFEAFTPDRFSFS